MTPYRTLLARGRDEFIVNKSRFIGSCAPAESEEEALAFLAEMRRAHPEASHNCYAYVVGPNMGIMRYSDDGEPGGTAGMPILHVLRARGVVNCCLVVTRYFGGVLLGAGGLARAYARGASLALDAGGVGTMHPTRRYLMDVPYPMLGKLDHCLKDLPVRVEDREFAEVITLSFLVREADAQQVLAAIQALFSDRLTPILFEEFYLAWPEDA